MTAFLYLVIGMALGGISATIIMAMLFVAKEADEARTQMSNNVTPVITHQETT
jgi:hypothetical protein